MAAQAGFKGQEISERYYGVFNCSQSIFLVSAQASKKWSNKNNYLGATLRNKGPFLDAWAENVLLVFGKLKTPRYPSEMS